MMLIPNDSGRRRRPTLWSTFAVVAIIAGIGLSSSVADASHYRFPVEGMTTDAEVKSLRGAGVDTTLALLNAAAPLAKRRALALKTGLTFGRLTSLALQSDLLRITGVGPSMVKLLQSAGVRYSGDLASASSAPLLDRLKAANSVHHIAPVLPQVEALADWISQAKALEPMVEGVK